MDDYFYGVCYQYYKRQMRVWILLQHKYLRTSAVNINDRRFLFTDLLGGDTVDKESLETEQANFPIYFTTNESEEIINMTTDIQNKIEFLTRGTTEAQTIGVLSDQNIDLPANYPADDSDSGPDEPPPPKISKLLLP